jgi:hypothetical protein
LDQRCGFNLKIITTFHQKNWHSPSCGQRWKNAENYLRLQILWLVYLISNIIQTNNSASEAWCQTQDFWKFRTGRKLIKSINSRHPTKSMQPTVGRWQDISWCQIRYYNFFLGEICHRKRIEIENMIWKSLLPVSARLTVSLVTWQQYNSWKWKWIILIGIFIVCLLYISISHYNCSHQCKNNGRWVLPIIKSLPTHVEADLGYDNWEFGMITSCQVLSAAR